MTLAYRGTAYHGWQVQQNARSVCTVFQDALEGVLGRRYDVKGCSRTDAGVHANRFVLSVRCPEDRPPAIPCEALQKALNNLLPRDIAVLDCTDAPEGFHPRYDCSGKRTWPTNIVTLLTGSWQMRRPGSLWGGTISPPSVPPGGRWRTRSAPSSSAASGGKGRW